MRGNVGALAAGIAAATIALFACTAAASAATLESVGSAPPAPVGATDAGALDPSTPLQLDVVLAPRDPGALASFIEAVSDPSSPRYRHYLPRGEFAGAFGAAPATIAAVRASLRRAGLRPGPVSAGGLTQPVDTTAAQARTALHVGFKRLKLRSGRVAFANTSAPRVSSDVAGEVRAIAGLDNLAKRQPRLVRSKAHAAAAAPHATAPAACSAASTEATLDGAYTPADFASAYSLDGLYGIGAQGGGVNVALYELEPNTSSDIAAYQTCFGTSVTVTGVNVDGGATGPAAGSGEAALDIETVIGLAPQASITVYRGPNNTNGPLHTYQRIVADDTSQVISTSWGLCDPLTSSAEATAENTAFQQAATQGQTIVAASGDDGSEDCGTNALAADDPASQPFVTGVGGTTLITSPARTETVWNNGSGAGGGGRSSRWTLPSYQTGFLTGTRRGVPDVSADADPNTGYVVYYAGAWTAFGGTSAAAPLWGAILADANSSGLGSCSASTPVGFVNPALYRIASGGGFSAAFHDITTGDNDFTGTNGGQFAAGTGYDLASGLGTPIAYSSATSGLVPALCEGPAISGISPSSGPAAGGDTVTITGTNLGLAPASVRFGTTPATAVQQTGGTITATTPAGSGTVPVTVSDAYGTSNAASYTYTGSAPAPSTSTPPTSTTPTPTPSAATPTPATPKRALAITVTGALHYQLRRSIPASALHITRDARGRATRVSGTFRVAGAKGGTATVVYALRKHGSRWTGRVRIVDSRAHVARTFSLSGTPAVASSGRVVSAASARLGRRTAKLRIALGAATTR
jgi:subtilase family serine protease